MISLIARIFPHSAALILLAFLLVPRVHADPGAEATAIRAIREKVARMGDLKPWQKTLLENEVIPLHQAFVRSWNSKGVEVDQALLQDYLNDRCESRDSKAEKGCDAWVVLRFEKGCTQCMQAAPGIKKSIEARLLRRGYVSISLAPESIGIPNSVSELAGQDRAWTRERDFEQRLIEGASKNGIRALVSVAIRQLPPDSPDDPHADELHFGIHTFVSYRGESKLNENVSAQDYLRFSESLDFQVRESGEVLADRLLTEGLSRLATQKRKSARTEKVPAGMPLSRLELELAGIRSFQHASRVRLRLESFVHDSPELTLREVLYRRGEIAFEVQGVQDPALFAAKLSTLPLGDSSLGEELTYPFEVIQGPTGEPKIRGQLSASVSPRSRGVEPSGKEGE